MMRPRRSVLALAAIVLVALSAAAGATASVAAVWKFEGNELKATETVKGVAEESSLTLPGATLTCEFIRLKMTIKNTGGTGEAEITEFPLEKCRSSTNTCTVESVAAGKLPWLAHLVTVAGTDYLVIEKMEITVLLGGPLCALAESPIVIKGSAGGAISNVSHTITFDKSTFTATGTSLKVGATATEWQALFALKWLGPHKGESLEG
jgi:hypothetical protein